MERWVLQLCAFIAITSCGLIPLTHGVLEGTQTGVLALLKAIFIRQRFLAHQNRRSRRGLAHLPSEQLLVGMNGTG